MSKDIRLPAFDFLGYDIQEIRFKRIGNEELEELNINISSTKYDEDHQVYSIELRLSIDFANSKNSMIRILGGFKINDQEILEDKAAIHAVFSASIYPYLRTVFHNMIHDGRQAYILPTLDLRNLDLKNGISLKRTKV